jgi:hypothetical protein
MLLQDSLVISRYIKRFLSYTENSSNHRFVLLLNKIIIPNISGLAWLVGFGVFEYSEG